jgi:oligopeptidase B
MMRKDEQVASSRRRFLAQASAAAIVAVFAPLSGASGAILPRAPTPPRIPKTVSQLGRTRTDPYAWMKYVPASGTRDVATLPPILRSHLLAENNYAEAVLGAVSAEERTFHDAMRARTPVGGPEPELRRDSWSYGQDRSGPHPVYFRRRNGSDRRETLLDEHDRARGHAYYRTTGHQVSPDGKLYAWAEDIGGADRHRLCVRDVAGGTVRVVVDTDAYGYGGLVFAPSSRWLFWIWRDARNRPTRVYRTPVEGGARELVYEEADPAIFMALDRTAADGFVAITLSGPDTSEVRLVPPASETEVPVTVWPRLNGRRYSIDEWSGDLIALAEDGDAPDGRIARVDRATFAEKGDIVSHRAGIQILQVASFRSALVRMERRDGLPALILIAADGREKAVGFDAGAYALTVPLSQDHANGACRVMVETPADPPTWLDIDLATGTKSVLSAQQVAGHDPRRFEVRRILAPGADGEDVPITVLTRKGAKLDGRSPLLLYGYGAYGISCEALFDVAPTVLVDRGWTYAIAHVRGGSEKGRRWFLEGRHRKKHNSFDDFIACARHLTREGYAAPGKIVSYGLSAGGLLVTASMNRAPDLWAGVIATVPFVDMLNTMSDADHPLVPLFRPDWGDPLANAADYDYIASISPYENVKRAAYPPLLTTAGLKDDRVGYWEPAKLVAEVRSRSTSVSPAVLLTDMSAGHQASGGREAEMRKMARLYAFAQGCVDGRLG